jgi:hypothetical protein
VIIVPPAENGRCFPSLRVPILEVVLKKGASLLRDRHIVEDGSISNGISPRTPSAQQLDMTENRSFSIAKRLREGVLKKDDFFSKSITWSHAPAF